MRIEFSVDGLDEVIAYLEDFEDELMDALERGVTKALDDVREDAKMNVHVDSGDLRDSIKVSVKREADEVRGKCAATAEYAVYEEMGTGPKGNASDNGKAPVGATYHTGTYYRKDGTVVHSEGQPAHPYMYPAFNKDKIIKTVADEVKGGVEG